MGNKWIPRWGEKNSHITRFENTCTRKWSIISHSCSYICIARRVNSFITVCYISDFPIKIISVYYNTALKYIPCASVMVSTHLNCMQILLTVWSILLCGSRAPARTVSQRWLVVMFDWSFKVSDAKRCNEGAGGGTKPHTSDLLISLLNTSLPFSFYFISKHISGVEDRDSYQRYEHN